MDTENFLLLKAGTIILLARLSMRTRIGVKLITLMLCQLLSCFKIHIQVFQLIKFKSDFILPAFLMEIL